MLTFFILLLGLLNMLNAPVFAGNESHGGDIVVCDGKEPVVLDYYHAALKGLGETTPNIPDISNWPADSVVLHFSNSLKNYVLRFEFEQARIKLGPIETWAQADLKEVDDSDEPYFLPQGCLRKQGAVRQGNQMFVDPTYVAKLSPAQQGMLVVHEALFYVAQKHGQKTSVSTRNLIRQLLRRDSTTSQLYDAIHSLGSIVWWYEVLPGNPPCSEKFENRDANPRFICFERVSTLEKTIAIREVTTSNTIVSSDPVFLTCGVSGYECEITQTHLYPTVMNGHVLTWKGAKFNMSDGGRRLTFKHPTQSMTINYFRVSTTPWPFPIGNNF